MEAQGLRSETHRKEKVESLVGKRNTFQEAKKFLREKHTKHRSNTMIHGENEEAKLDLMLLVSLVGSSSAYPVVLIPLWSSREALA